MLQTPTAQRVMEAQYEVGRVLELPPGEPEQYALSLDQIRCLGEVALSGIDINDEILEGARRDFITSLAEILENEPQLRGRFEISDVYDYKTQGGEVVFNSAEGPRSLIGMIKSGAASSRLEAQQDFRMQTQAVRDEADVYNAERVNLMIGDQEVNTRLVVSRDLGRAFDESPDFWQSRGYRKGLAMIQLYYVENGQVTAGTFSVDNVEDSIFDKALAENGVIAPQDDNSNSVRYGIERSFSSKHEALEFAENFRSRCYELQGDSTHRLSVNEYINQRKNQIEVAFKTLYTPLAKAVASRQNNSELKQFARSLLIGTNKLSPDNAGRLQNIVHADSFSYEDGRFILGLSLYATTELLLADGSKDSNTIGDNSVTPLEILDTLTTYIILGVEAGRKHGGACPGTFEYGNNLGDKDDPQAAFGGAKEKADKWDWKKGYCRIPQCPTLPGKTSVGPCAVCRKCQSKFDSGLSFEKIINIYSKDSRPDTKQLFTLAA